jgi:hypothetical protein
VNAAVAWYLADGDRVFAACPVTRMEAFPILGVSVRFKMRPRWHQLGCGLPSANFASTASVLWFISKTLLQFMSWRN